MRQKLGLQQNCRDFLGLTLFNTFVEQSCHVEFLVNFLMFMIVAYFPTQVRPTSQPGPALWLLL